MSDDNKEKVILELKDDETFVVKEANIDYPPLKEKVGKEFKFVSK